MTVVLTVAYAAYFSWFDIGRHHKTNSTRFDLGNVEQVEWNLIHGRGFTLTDPYGTATVARFAFHADPFLIVLAPFYFVVPKTETLLLLQVLIVASGVVAVYGLGRKILSAWWGVLFAAIYTVHPALQWSTIFDIHAVTLATSLILWAALAAINKKYIWTLVFVLLAAATKEEIGLGLMIIGFFVWWRQGQLKWGMILTFVPVVWALMMLLVVLPAHQSSAQTNDEVYRTVFGSGARDIARGALKHPLTLFHQLTAHQNLTMLYQELAPLGFLPLGSWWSLGAGPDYAINALSLKPAQHLIISHYTSGLTPWLFIGAIMVVRWLRSKISRLQLRHDRTTLSIALGLWLAGWAGSGAWMSGPLPGTPHDASPVVRWRNDYAAPVARWEKAIPSSVAVSVTNNIGSHFARREHFYSFPRGVDQADYVVVLEDHATAVVATQTEVTAKITALRHDPRWRILSQQGDLTVLRRR